jgi:hypothetical protein
MSRFLQPNLSVSIPNLFKVMSMVYRNSFFILMLLLANSCQQSNTSLSDEQHKSLSDTIRQTLNNYYTDIKREGLTAEFRYLDSSSEFFWVPPGYQSSISYDSVISIFKTNAPLFKSIDISWEELQINPLTKELAVYTGKLRSISIDTSGKVFDSKLVETGLLIRRNGGWKLLSGQTAMVAEK